MRKRKKTMYIKIKSTKQMKAQVNNPNQKQTQTINKKIRENPMQMGPIAMK
jgi:hypothetical protein